MQPGQIVGEVTAFEGARITVNVSTGVRHQLNLGQFIPVRAGQGEFTAEIVQLADGPSAKSTLWQVEMFVAATPEIVQPGDLVTVKLPVGQFENSETVFIPLDAVTIRQTGVILFTVGAGDIVAEHVVAVTGFISDFVEGVVDIEGDAMVVIEGNRLLRSGDVVSIRSGS